jgi:hypothetical protein
VQGPPTGRGHQTDDPPGLCRAASALHLERGGLCTCRQDKGPRGEVSLHRWRNDTKRGPQAAKAAARSPERLWVVRVGHPLDLSRQGPSTAGLGDPYVGSVGASAISEETANRDTPRKTAKEEVDRDPRNE